MATTKTETAKDLKAMNVYEKLLHVQMNLRVPKDRINDDNGDRKFRFRTLEQIFSETKPLLKEVGATLVCTDRVEFVGGKNVVIAKAVFIDIATGQTVEAEGNAAMSEKKGGMDSSQLTGSASSYARKYAVCGLFCIDDNKDPDEPEKTAADGPGAPVSENTEQGKPAENADAGPEEEHPENTEQGKLVENAEAGPEEEHPEDTAEETLDDEGKIVIGVKPEDDGQKKTDLIDAIMILTADKPGLVKQACDKNGVGSLGEMNLEQLAHVHEVLVEHFRKQPPKTKKKVGGADAVSACMPDGDL